MILLWRYKISNEELSQQEKVILLLAQVISHYPYKTSEVTGDAYIDAITEINLMSEESKRSFVNEMIEMTEKFPEPLEGEAVVKN